MGIYLISVCPFAVVFRMDSSVISLACGNTADYNVRRTIMADQVEVMDVDTYVNQAPIEERQALSERCTVALEEVNDLMFYQHLVDAVERISTENSLDIKQRMIEEVLTTLSTEYEFSQHAVFIQQYVRPNVNDMIQQLPSRTAELRKVMFETVGSILDSVEELSGVNVQA